MDTPYGPHRITGNRQIAIPKELADSLHLNVGDKVYFLASSDVPGTISIVPMELMSSWIAAGKRASTGDVSVELHEPGGPTDLRNRTSPEDPKPQTTPLLPPATHPTEPS